MLAIGIPHKFIAMTRLLFYDASDLVKVNGMLSSSFGITCGVR